MIAAIARKSTEQAGAAYLELSKWQTSPSSRAHRFRVVTALQ